MQLILRADVDNLGRLGDIVKVKPGYARNYLIPQGLAYPATKSNKNIFEQERKKLQQKMEARRYAAQSLAEKLEQANIVIPVRVGEHNKLHGSVTSAMIAQVLADMGLEVDRRTIELDKPITTLGKHEIPVKLHQDVLTNITVNVVQQGSEEHLEQTRETPEKAE